MRLAPWNLEVVDLVHTLGLDLILLCVLVHVGSDHVISRPKISLKTNLNSQTLLAKTCVSISTSQSGDCNGTVGKKDSFLSKVPR